MALRFKGILEQKRAEQVARGPGDLDAVARKETIDDLMDLLTYKGDVEYIDVYQDALGEWVVESPEGVVWTNIGEVLNRNGNSILRIPVNPRLVSDDGT